MQKVLRWLIAIIGGLALLAIALFVLARLRGPDAEQKAAIALLERTPPPPGRNAFALLWLMPYDVPESELERVLAEDVRRFEKMSVPGSGESFVSFDSIAAHHYPSPSAAPGRERERYCRWRERDCLAKVRAEPDAYARLLETDAALVARADTITDYTHVRSPFPPRLDMPFPPYQYLAYPMTRHAAAFASGDVDAALQGTCRGISGARMLIRDGDNLISSMIGAAMLEGNAGLLADMLAELPANRPLPAFCSIALTPPSPDEFSLCKAMRGEASFMFATMQHVDTAKNPTGNPWQDRFWPGLYDHEKTIARAAPPLAWHCGDEVRAAIASDVPARPPPSATTSWHPLECIDNFAGCVLTDIASPAYSEYQQRLQDAAIRLKTVATLLWLRDRPEGQALSERLANRPAELRSPGREMRLAEDGTALSVALFDTRQGDTWSLPVPASRQKQAVRTSP